MKTMVLLTVFAALLIAVPFAGAAVAGYDSDGFFFGPGDGVFVRVGLANGNDTSTFVDVVGTVAVRRAGGEVSLVGAGQMNGVRLAGPGSFSHSTPVAMPIVGNSGAPLTGELELAIDIRIACPKMDGHSSGTARLWYNDQGVTLKVHYNGVPLSLYLGSGGDLSPVLAGSRVFKNLLLKGPKKNALCGEWREFGTWTADD